uniref:Uncharacterized protein n=1 Tax=Glossina palpalis gambiensis TaxID=67801 RepID=A0A1B0AX66_9MUSC
MQRNKVIFVLMGIVYGCEMITSIFGFGLRLLTKHVDEELYDIILWNFNKLFLATQTREWITNNFHRRIVVKYMFKITGTRNLLRVMSNGEKIFDLNFSIILLVPHMFPRCLKFLSVPSHTLITVFLEEMNSATNDYVEKIFSSHYEERDEAIDQTVPIKQEILP